MICLDVHGQVRLSDLDRCGFERLGGELRIGRSKDLQNETVRELLDPADGPVRNLQSHAQNLPLSPSREHSAHRGAQVSSLSA